jgi:hypothetical protein
VHPDLVEVEPLELAEQRPLLLEREQVGPVDEAFRQRLDGVLDGPSDATESSRDVIGALTDLLRTLLGIGERLPGVRRDQKRKRLLRDMLEDERYEWRSIGTLARSIGASEDRTRELLISIGARASAGAGEEMWGLAERVGTTGTRRS